MLPMLADRRDEIADLCRRFRVSRLETFGSAARGTDFVAERSDIDILVFYDPTKRTPSLDEFFGLQEALAALFGRKVDLITAGSVENPYVRAGIERDKQVLYAAVGRRTAVRDHRRSTEPVVPGWIRTLPIASPN